MQVLTITGIEDAINECIRLYPQTGVSISPPARALADIYGLMIFERAAEIDFTSFVKNETFGEKHVEAVGKFYNAERRN
jgi:hypothetical protein